jgi:hypothetical protein
MFPNITLYYTYTAHYLFYRFGIVHVSFFQKAIRATGPFVRSKLTALVAMGSISVGKDSGGALKSPGRVDTAGHVQPGPALQERYHY